MTQGRVKDILDSFEGIGLEELDKASLLDRIDTKYVFTVNLLPGFLEQLRTDYYVLDLDNNRMFRYNSLYFDTDNFQMFNLHSSGRSNRYKVRWRKYMETGISFFEVKFKNNKGRTLKSRVPANGEESFDDRAVGLVQTKTPFGVGELEPKMWVNFRRITLVSKDFKERLTIDTELTFRNESDEKCMEQLVIAEVKQGRHGSSVFSRIMKEARIRQGSLSKYCYGVVSLFDSVKKNNFKKQLHLINKLLYVAAPGH